ncbi:MAG: hypothetical protein V4617_16335 [Gemmatimonadota bacterium]
MTVWTRAAMGLAACALLFARSTDLSLRIAPASVASLTDRTVAPAAVVTASAAADSAAADSAAVARTFYRDALAHHQRGALDSAVVFARHAQDRWPSQSAYAVLVALLSARQSDARTLVNALDQLTRMEAGGEVTADSAIRRMTRSPSVLAEQTARAVARLERATAPMPRSRIFATLHDSTLFPEGLDIDGGTGTLYVASVRHGVVVERRANGRERRIPLDAAQREGAALAVRLDARRTHLWITTSGIGQSLGWTPADSGLAALLRVRAADGVVERRYPLPVVPGGHTLGDVAVSATGDVYVSDSNHPVLYRLRAGGDSLEAFRSPLFRSLQGIAPSADGSAVYVADYSHGILRFDPATGAVRRVSDASGTTALGIDGLVLHGRHLIAIQNGISPMRVVRLALDSTGMRITEALTLDRQAAPAGEPTIGAVAGDAFVYVSNSGWAHYDARGRRVAGTRLAPPVIRRLPLTPPARH